MMGRLPGNQQTRRINRPLHWPAAVAGFNPVRRAQHRHRLPDSKGNAWRQGLMVTLDYDQARLDGPPFSVADDEVRAGFAGWQVETLEEREIIQESPKFEQAGITRLIERVYRLLR